AAREDPGRAKWRRDHCRSGQRIDGTRLIDRGLSEGLLALPGAERWLEKEKVRHEFSPTRRFGKRRNSSLGIRYESEHLGPRVARSRARSLGGARASLELHGRERRHEHDVARSTSR